ncbi:MAG: APC family permease [Pseudomonadota bacterium]
MNNTEPRQVGYWEATAIGIGGMVGGGIFAVLGLAVDLTHGGAPVAFLIAGAVALVTAYSYARLSVAFPSQGGTVAYLDRAFGAGLLTGGMNILLWLSYMVMLSLYARAFGSYGASLFPAHWHGMANHVLTSAVIVVITGLNLLSARLIGKAEDWVVFVKLAILALFIGAGFPGVDAARLAPAAWSTPLHLVAGGMIIFLAYEGFELIANTARDVRNAATTLPRAFYSAVVFVIVLYVLVAIVAVGNLPVGDIVAARDYALAAARPFLGQTGFTLIAVAAVLSTTSAINATLYGAARLSYIIARDGELPAVLERRLWNRPVEGLLITSAVTLLAANLVDLSSLSTLGSAGFLLIFAAVNAANVRLARRAHSRRWLAWLGVVLCLCALAALLWQTLRTAPGRLWILVGMTALAFAIEFIFRVLTGRALRVSG